MISLSQIGPPTDQPVVDLVEVYARMGRAAEAESACRAGTQRFPLDSRFDLLLATLLTHRGAQSDAALVLEHAVHHTGRRDPTVLDAWATTLASLGRYEEAAHIEEEALALAPGPYAAAVLRSRLEAFRQGRTP